MEDSSIRHVVNGGKTYKSVGGNSGKLTENLLPPAETAFDIEHIVEDEVQRAVQEVLEANSEESLATQPLMATVLHTRNNSDLEQQHCGDDESLFAEENRKIHKVCGLPEWLFDLLVILLVPAVVGGITAIVTTQ